MTGLQLGEIVFDPAHFIYLPRLKALVCVGLLEGLRAPGKQGAALVSTVDLMLKRYQPESLIAIGDLDLEVAGILSRWRSRAKFIPVSSEANYDVVLKAEKLGLELHKELVWGGYRFKDTIEAEPELPFLSVTGPPPGMQYYVRLGRAPWKGFRLPVFLKGPGRLVLPSLNPNAKTALLLNSPYRRQKRYDVFAIGHARILPLGKITDLGAAAGLNGRLPFNRDVLGGSLKHRRQYGKHLVS